MYKTYGEDNGISDHLLSWAGSVSAIVNGLCRLSMGYFYDKIGFRAGFMILMSVQLISSIVVYWAVQIDWLYFILILLNYFSSGGIFAIMPPSVIKVYGVENGS